jgi:hypothetical protein
VIDQESYCREIEAYLCQKNDGHLVRIAGPAFELVSGWARAGVPFKIACLGIDRYFERYYRRGRRRRPLRLDFCDADVLQAFDDWKRAIGVAGALADAVPQVDTELPLDTSPRRGPSLSTHIEQLLVRLTRLRASSERAIALDAVLADTVRRLDGMQADARRLRGEARQRALDALGKLDRELSDAAVAALPADDRARLDVEAQRELAPFRPRMSPEVYARAREAAFDRIVREHFRLPRVAYE